MSQPFRFVTADRLQIREGGGCMSVFGVPFFGAGVFLVLILVGVVPLSNAHEMPALGWPLLVLMAIAFTAVGGGLVFGRSWTTIDRAQRQVLKQLGLLVPLRARVIPLDGYNTVTLGFVQGDSDTVDKFLISLTGSTAADLLVCSFTTYQQARQCTKAIAEHLQLEIEDGTTDHPVRLTPGQLDATIRNRVRQADARLTDSVRPPDARSQVTHEMEGVTIVIPSRPMRLLVLATTLIPMAVLLVMVPSLATFFKRSNTPDPVGWAFLGFLILFFGILPISTIGGAFLRSRRGATIVEASRRGLLVHERGAWTTRTIGSFDAAEILDVDYSSRESSAASARRAAEREAFQAYPAASHTTGPRFERIMTRLARFAQSKGITVKTRSGLTTFGQGLEDEEIRYLYSVVRRALVE